MQDFPANSHKAKETAAPREKIKPVTSAKTGGRRKRGVGRQFKETFFKGTAQDVRGFIIEDVVVPAIRDTIHEAIQGGLERLIYGDRVSPRARVRSPLMSQAPGHVSYDRISTQQSKPQSRTISKSSRVRHEFHEILIPSSQEAHEVLERMYDYLSQYGEVSLAHLYDLTDIEPSHTDLKWGWRSLKGAKALRLRSGEFLLDLPEPEPLG